MLLKATTSLGRNLLTSHRFTQNVICKNLSFNNQIKLMKYENASSIIIKNNKKSNKLDHILKNSIYTTNFKLSDTKQPQEQQKPLIFSAQTNAPLSDELRKIMEKKFTSEEESKAKTGESNLNLEKSSERSGSNEENEPPKGRLGMLFSREHAWKVSLTFFVALFGGSLVYILVDWGAPRVDENGLVIKDEFSDFPLILQYPKRALHAVLTYYEMIKDPSTDKLLPDPVQPPYYQPPYTLVIEMSGLLLHPEWTLSTGWRYKKRPGLDYFIDQIKYPTFEVVLFTREPFLNGAPIASSLDPQQQIQFKLFRESTKFLNNNYVKDLSFMNRDLSKIIVIDWDESAYQLQPRNALHRLKKWEGDEQDVDLVYLASFLKMIANSGVSDVREVLDYYNAELNPLETFKIKQVKLKEEQLKRQQEMELLKEKQKKSPFSLFRR